MMVWSRIMARARDAPAVTAAATNHARIVIDGEQVARALLDAQPHQDDEDEHPGQHRSDRPGEPARGRPHTATGISHNAHGRNAARPSARGMDEGVR
jgi:hypothetical protein